jgi:cytochrome c553
MGRMRRRPFEPRGRVGGLKLVAAVPAALGAAAWVVSAGIGGPAAAQTVRAAAGEDFRATYATPQEVSQGERIAAGSCARCHGPKGVSAARGVPHLAGQRAVYLHRELLAYKSGARGKNMMADAATFLSDDALYKVAAWYASLDPAPPATTASPAVAVEKATGPDPVSAGRAAAASCGSCHGEGGVSAMSGMPSLAGLDPKYLAASINSYRNGQRRHDLMKALVSGLSEADVGNIALYYASLTPDKAKTPAEGDPAAGRTAAVACAGCHGEAGVGAASAPGLAGQDAQYFATAMRAYREGARADAIMKGPAATVSDTQVAALAAYYAGLPPQAPKRARPMGVSDWVGRCDRCHGVNGNSTDPRIPALAAQRADYLEPVLQAYRTGTRKSETMSAMAMVLTEADARQLADYYARQRARPVVYVQLPPRE